MFETLYRVGSFPASMMLIAYEWKGAISIKARSCVFPEADPNVSWKYRMMFTFHMKDAWKGFLDKVHVLWLMLYSDRELKEEVLLPHILWSERGTGVQSLIALFETKERIMLKILWCGLPHTEATSVPLLQVFRNVPDFVPLLNVSENSPCTLVQMTRAVLGLSSMVCHI